MMDRLSLDSPAWGAFVERMPDAMPFHHPAWASTIARAYGFDGFALALRGSSTGEGDYVAGAPVIELRSPLTRRRRWSSLPFTDTCPALTEPGDAVRFAMAVDEHRIGEGVVEVEISGALPGIPAVTSVQRVQHVLSLDPDPDVVARGYRSSVRRNIRSARASDLRLRRATTEVDMADVFYRLQVMTRRRLGLPPQPRRFFRAIWRGIVATGLGHLTIVEASRIPVAAAIFLRWNGTTIYKYGASDPSAWHLRPNNLLFANEIESACSAGCATFHFGRTDVDDEGLRRFKLGWGAEEKPLRSTWFGARPHAERSGPPEFLRAVVRRSPPFVVRTVGEALYRYVA
jgi:CelD/BcsL family acetyltransferase involved in cellulose biosynthesis